MHSHYLIYVFNLFTLLKIHLCRSTFIIRLEAKKFLSPSIAKELDQAFNMTIASADNGESTK